MSVAELRDRNNDDIGKRALARAVNDRIRELTARFQVIADRFEILCECGRLDCLQRVSVPIRVYDDLRGVRERYLVKSGHESSPHERVVEASADFSVVAAPEILGVTG